MGIDAVAVFCAAEDTAVGATRAMASQVAEISAAEPANRFMVLPLLSRVAALLAAGPSPGPAQVRPAIIRHR
jgi:hypothetical protein